MTYCPIKWVWSGSCGLILKFGTMNGWIYALRELWRKFELRLLYLKSFTLWNVSGQLYSFYSTDNSVKSDRKRIITVNFMRDAICFLHRLICTMCLKYLPLAHMHVLSPEYHWPMDASVVRCSMLCQTFIFITESNEQCIKQNIAIMS